MGWREKIRLAGGAKGFRSDKAIADALGINQRTFAGRMQPNPTTGGEFRASEVVALARLFQVDAIWLFDDGIPDEPIRWIGREAVDRSLEIEALKLTLLLLDQNPAETLQSLRALAERSVEWSRTSHSPAPDSHI